MNFADYKSLTIPEGGVRKITCNGTTLWESRSLPLAYQEVEWVQAASGVKAYIDLGFAFDTKATVYLTQWYVDTTFTRTYPFGGSLDGTTAYERVLFLSPNAANAAAVGGYNASNGTIFSAVYNSPLSPGKREFILRFDVGELYIEDVTMGLNARTTSQKLQASTHFNLYLFAQNYNGAPRFGGVRRLGRFQYYDKNDTLICSLIPCYRKSDGVIGMYDVARSLFLTNVGSGTFTKGADL